MRDTTGSVPDGATRGVAHAAPIVPFPDSPVTYSLHVHLAIAGAIVFGVAIGWLLLAPVIDLAVGR